MSAGTVAWLSSAPVKGLALLDHGSVLVGPGGLEGDRRFHLIDETGRLVNGKRLGGLALVAAEYDPAASTLELRFPDGAVVGGEVVLGVAIETGFYGTPRHGRAVIGPWSEALASYANVPLRLVATEQEGAGLDRDKHAAVSLLSTASLAQLAGLFGIPEVDRRRFRMGVGIDGVSAHQEDEWFGRRVRIGGAVIVPHAHIGRCAVTTQNPETGLPDLDTLGAIKHYRGEIETEEPIPFGVQARVAEPGVVRVGDPVSVD
jgi:uncharacterized protein YcbX